MRINNNAAKHAQLRMTNNDSAGVESYSSYDRLKIELLMRNIMIACTFDKYNFKWMISTTKEAAIT